MAKNLVVCVCDTWIKRLWKDEGLMGQQVRQAMYVSFTCPEHGHIELDNRDNPTPHVDARDPVRQHLAHKMIENDAKRDAEDREEKRKNPWKYRDHRVRC